MKYLVQYSGGVGSFAAAVECVRRYGKENVELLFADTLAEDEDLYRFLVDTQKALDIPLHRIADGRDPWQVFEDVKFLGNSRVDPCSRILKREICKKWVVERHSPEEVTIVLGIDWTEEHRVINFQRWWSPYVGIAPLTARLSDGSMYDKNRFMLWMENELKVRRPRLYELGFPHNNCGGFCVKAGKAHFLHLLETIPARYTYHEMREREMQRKLGKDYTILREQRNGVKSYISLTELRQRAEQEKQTEEGRHDWGGCGCFSDIPEEEMPKKEKK